MASATTDLGHSAVYCADVNEELAELADDELLDRYLGPDEPAAEAAFRVLVRRHGPMVLGVCRHILDQFQDAEDAFQATFLVLARKAVTVNDRRVLARWLYEVAYRIAIRSRALASSRRLHERQGVEMAAVAPTLEQDPGWIELRPVIHEEVNRLPEKYRTAVVLCYLEGRTNEEAAEMLRWPVGTVKGRLSRAREMLRARLTRRGLGLSAMFLLTSLARNEAFAEVVPSRLVETTARTALHVRRGGGLCAGVETDEISEQVARLAEDGTPATRWSVSKNWIFAVALGVSVTVLIFLGLTAGTSLGGTTGGFLTNFPALSRFFSGAAPTSCH